MKITLYGPDEIHRKEVDLDRVPMKGELLTVTGMYDLMLTYRVMEVETMADLPDVVLLHLINKDHL